MRRINGHICVRGRQGQGNWCDGGMCVSFGE